MYRSRTARSVPYTLGIFVICASNLYIAREIFDTIDTLEQADTSRILFSKYGQRIERFVLRPRLGLAVGPNVIEVSDTMLASAMQAAISAGLLKRHSSEAEIEANKAILHAILCAALANMQALGTESALGTFDAQLQNGSRGRL